MITSWSEQIQAAVDDLCGPAAASDSPASESGADSVPGDAAVGIGAVRARLRPVWGGRADPGPWQPFTGAVGELAPDPDDPAVLRAGLGDPDAATPETALRAGLGAGRRAVALPAAVEPPEHPDPDVVAAWVAGVVRGAGVGARLDLSRAAGAGADGVAGHTGGDADPVGLLDAGWITGAAANLAQTLTAAPANLLEPTEFAAVAADVAGRCGLECVVHDEDALAELGCGGLLAVGAGSDRPPRLVDLRYRPPSALGRITLVGKGITFDSGGLSLKPPAAQMDMRSDKAGAAVVLAVVAAVARLGLPVEVRGLLALAENLPGPRATKPGDVIHAPNGTEIQVMDTDFEGRLVLADGLCLAGDERPDLIVDVATLTYQVVVALGPEIAGVLSRDPALAQEVVTAGAAVGEPWWPLPYARRYEQQIRTARGVRNHPMAPDGRAITAALFLGAFVAEDQPWIHADIAGPAWSGDASGDNATGFAVATLLRLIADRVTGQPARTSPDS